MNLLLLGFIIQLVMLYGMILFSDYLKELIMDHSSLTRRRPVKVRIKKP